MTVTDTMPHILREIMPADPVTRVRVLVGEDDDAERRGSKTPIAQSECVYHCATSQIAAACIEALRESDERLRQRPEELMLWDWKSTYFQLDPTSPAGGGDVILGVAWYDEEFYQERRGAWLSRMHRRIYERLEISQDDISVRHWRPEIDAA